MIRLAGLIAFALTVACAKPVAGPELIPDAPRLGEECLLRLPDVTAEPVLDALQIDLLSSEREVRLIRDADGARFRTNWVWRWIPAESGSIRLTVRSGPRAWRIERDVLPSSNAPRNAAAVLRLGTSNPMPGEITSIRVVTSTPWDEAETLVAPTLSGCRVWTRPASAERGVLWEAVFTPERTGRVKVEPGAFRIRQKNGAVRTLESGRLEMETREPPSGLRGRIVSGVFRAMRRTDFDGGSRKPFLLVYEAEGEGNWEGIPPPPPALLGASPSGPKIEALMASNTFQRTDTERGWRGRRTWHYRVTPPERGAMAIPDWEWTAVDGARIVPVSVAGLRLEETRSAGGVNEADSPSAGKRAAEEYRRRAGSRPPWSGPEVAWRWSLWTLCLVLSAWLFWHRNRARADAAKSLRREAENFAASLAGGKIDEEFNRDIGPEIDERLLARLARWTEEHGDVLEGADADGHEALRAWTREWKLARFAPADAAREAALRESAGRAVERLLRGWKRASRWHVVFPVPKRRSR